MNARKRKVLEAAVNCSEKIHWGFSLIFLLCRDLSCPEERRGNCKLSSFAIKFYSFSVSKYVVNLTCAAHAHVRVSDGRGDSTIVVGGSCAPYVAKPCRNGRGLPPLRRTRLPGLGRHKRVLQSASIELQRKHRLLSHVPPVQRSRPCMPSLARPNSSHWQCAVVCSICSHARTFLARDTRSIQAAALRPHVQETYSDRYDNASAAWVVLCAILMFFMVRGSRGEGCVRCL